MNVLYCQKGKGRYGHEGKNSSIWGIFGKLGIAVFASCSSLWAVNYGGTGAQWEGIDKGNNWIGWNASIWYVECYDGTIYI